MRPIHHVFDIGYTGVVRELRSEARIFDPLSERSLILKQAIWDTGATSTALNSSIARAFGLVATGQTLAVTANGTAVVNTYVINLGLPQKVLIRGLNVMDGDLGDNTDLLIGMDVIAMGDFIVQNCAGMTHFSFCIPPFENKYEMVSKANQVNERNQKANAKRLLGSRK